MAPGTLASGTLAPGTLAPGTLYVVATPIGNLEDLSVRALRVLGAADAIAAEDTRHTGKLLHHFQITTPQVSFHAHNQASRIPALVARLQQGAAIALVTDAGTPAISDPGTELVAACVAVGVPVVPVPGACAAIAALCAAGLPTDRFAFEGFLPPKPKARREVLQGLATEPRTLIFYESPHRLAATLADLAAAFGAARPVAIARELTKRHEAFWRGTLAGAIAAIDTPALPVRGEFVLVIGGAPAPGPAWSDPDIIAELQTLIAGGMSRSAASRHLATQAGLPRRHLYQLALTLPDPPSP